MPKMPEAKLPLPKFKSEEDEARYWETHSIADIWDKLTPVKPIKLSPAQSKAIRERHAARKAAISIRLESAQIREARRIAARKSIGYQTQLRLWIAEGIRRERSSR